MIDFHTQEVLEEIRDAIEAHLESDDVGNSVAEDLLQDILDKVCPLLDRDG